MIIELFGLPASGKSTLARALEEGGAVRVMAPRGLGLLLPAFLFFCRYPLRSLLHFRSILRFAPRGARYTLFVNTILVHAGKWHRANQVARHGDIALLDQGHHQNLLSVFGHPPPDPFLASYVRSLPRPDLLLVVTADAETRAQRLRGRGVQAAEAVVRRTVAEGTFERVLPLLASRMPVEPVGDRYPALGELLTKHLSYVSIARMPTEKAHGISIAHMCAAYAALGSRVALILPTRKNAIAADVPDYYGVPDAFAVQRIKTPDFIGHGHRHPLFFFLQRLLFVRALKREGVPFGTLYTREPEIAFAFAASHQVVYEAHRWPSGVAGLLTALLVRGARLVVCNSKGTEASARRAGIIRTLVAPNGFDPKDFLRPETKEAARARLALPEGPLALYAGLLARGKGVGTLFAAGTLLAQDVRVAVIGGSEEETERLAKEYPLVRFLGFRPYTELADNLVAADVLILPNTMTDTESSTYTSPIKLFAYMASGIPIVASDVPAVREMLSDENAFLASPDSPEALAEGIRDALMRTEEASRRAARAALCVRDYTWQRRAERVLAALTPL